MCAEKERLLDLLKLANHELPSLVQEVGRLASQEPGRAEELNQILTSAKEAQKKAEGDYIAHVFEHGCGTQADADALERGIRSDPTALRRKTEEYWRDRMREKRQEYDLAVSQLREVLAEQKESPLPSPDGLPPIRKALLHESTSGDEYTRALRTFTNLTLYGKMPEEH